MSSQEFENLLAEALEHLEQGRYRMSLKAAQKAYEINPDNERVICCYAVVKLENGLPQEALDLVDTAVNISDTNLTSRYSRAYILYRLGIHESAVSDTNYILAKDKSFRDAYLIKARVLASLMRYKEAIENLESAARIKKSEESEYLKVLIATATGYSQKIFSKTASRKDLLLASAQEALKKKEFWFSLWASREVIKDRKYVSLHRDARLLELKALLHLFQYKEAFEVAEKLLPQFDQDNEFNLLFRRIIKKYPEGEQRISARTPGNTEIFDNPYFTVQSIHCFDYLRSMKRDKRDYLVQFDGSEITYIGAEVTLENPFYNNRDIDVEGVAIWYQNEVETGRHKFNIKLRKDWKTIEFVQSWGTAEPGFWKKGSAKVLFLLDNNAVCAKHFDIRDFEIAEKPKQVRIAQDEPEIKKNETKKFDDLEAGDSPDENEEPGIKDVQEESLEDLLNDLSRLTGLNSVKQALWDFVTYLKFINERKKHGLKTTGEFSVHCVFTGNPGTGKTTVARKLGKIFKAMGILRSGHVIEVDRAALVGQYVGETAQKTEKIINEASGGILFIDEAYTLSKKGNAQDFGQEAIDIILKRMEDKKDDFAVIAAGYPVNMEPFINSNPGLKSRFSHFFHFDDYTPDELCDIFRQMASEEDFVISEDALTVLKKEFVRLYRKRDEAFGNARIAKKHLNDIKLNVSRRVTGKEEKLSKEAFTLIIKEDVELLFSENGGKKFSFGIEEDKLTGLLARLNALTGLDNVKKEINEIVKLTRYYIDNGEDPQKNISGHLVFLGNPGTGKTTVARLFSEIYSALGILPKGHLVEVDRQALVGQYVGQTAIKTKEVIDSAMGGTLFIDEAYSLVKGDRSDFGMESIDTLIKRMEDDKGKFILIAAGYTDETNHFLDVNPGLSSRFYKKIHFDDYTPQELGVIALKFLEEKKLRPSEEAVITLMKILLDAYQKRDKKFGNARYVRNLTDKIIRNHLLYVAGLDKEKRTSEDSAIISDATITQLLQDSAPQWNKGLDSEPLQIMQELNALTGLDEVKKNLSRLISSLKVADMREKRGLKNVPRKLHSVFFGTPGTGKSTAAEIFSRIYQSIGILSKGHIVYGNKLNLGSAYVGQSKNKTIDLVKRAKGGILYIEEAEFLYTNPDQGNEIIETLIDFISAENDIICVLALGDEKSAEMIKADQQMCKHFVNYFEFREYNPRELVEIAYSIAEKNNYRLDEGALQLLMDHLNELHKSSRTNENARLVKELVYKAISAQEERLFQSDSLSNEDLTTLIFEDVRKATESLHF